MSNALRLDTRRDAQPRQCCKETDLGVLPTSQKAQ